MYAYIYKSGFGIADSFQELLKQQKKLRLHLQRFQNVDDLSEAYINVGVYSRQSLLSV